MNARDDVRGTHVIDFWKYYGRIRIAKRLDLYQRDSLRASIHTMPHAANHPRVVPVALLDTSRVRVRSPRKL